MPINLGAGVFDFVINGANFGRSLSSMGASVSTFASKTTEGMSKSVVAFGKYSKASAQLTEDIDKSKKATQSFIDAQDALEKGLKVKERTLNRHSREVNKLTKEYKDQETVVKGLARAPVGIVKQMAANLRAGGMDRTAAAVQAQKDYDAKLAQERQLLADIEKKLLKKNDLRVRAIKAYDIENEKLIKNAAQIDVEKAKLEGLENQQKRLAAAPPPTNVQKIGAQVHDFATKSAESLSTVAKLTSKASMTIERMTRGIRGVSPEWARVQERIYAANAALDTHRARIEQARAAVKRDQEAINTALDERLRREKRIQEAHAFEAELIARVKKAQADLSRKQADPRSSSEAIRVQAARVQTLTTRLERYQTAITNVVNRGKEEEKHLDSLNAKLKTSEAFLGRLETETGKYQVSVQAAQAKMAALTQRVKSGVQAFLEKRKAMKEADLAQRALGDRSNWLMKIWNSLFGQSRKVDQSFASNKREADKLAHSINGLSTRFGLFVAAFTGSALGTFFGNLANSTRMAVGQAFDLYKNYELVSLSMQSMVTAENMRTGQFATRAMAEEAAILRSQELMEWMRKLAIASPFSQDDIKQSMQLGLSLGFTTEQMQRLTNATVNWAAGTGRSGFEIEQVTRALGQMNANQRVTLEDLNQLTNVGIGWTEVLEKEFAPEIAKSGKSLRDLISAGVIPADRAISALTETFETDYADGAQKAGTSMQGLVSSLGDLKNEALRAAFSKIFEAIQPLIAMFTDALVNGGIIERVRAFGEAIGTKLGEALLFLRNLVPQILSIWSQFGPTFMEGLGLLQQVATEAYLWGKNIIQMVADGMWSQVSGIIEIIQEIGALIGFWMAPGSPPRFLPQIDQWGKQTMETWAIGMSSADMGIITSFGDKVRGILGNMVRLGDAKEEDVIPSVIGTEDEIRYALAQLNATGSVSEETFARIRAAAGPAAFEVEKYARYLFNAQAATNAVKKAQENLNQVTKQYEDRLKPLQDRLNAMSNARAQNERKQELESLQAMLRTMQNPEGMRMDTSGVESRIAELQLEEEIAQVESERNAAIATAETQLSQAEEQQQIEQERLDLIQTQMEFDSRRRDLMAEQLDTLKRIREETEKQGKATDNAALAAERAADQAKKLSDAQFETAYAAASAEERIKLLEERLLDTQPGTIEYEKLQQRLTKAQDEYNKELERSDKALQKVSDQEFEAKLATMSRAEQIEALKERQQTLSEGSLEYLKMQERINKLQMAEDKAAEKKLKTGGGGGLGGMLDDKGMLGGRPFEGVNKTLENTNRTIDETVKKVEKVQKKFEGFSKSISYVFKRLGEYGAIIGFIIQRFLMSALIGIAIQKIVRPLWALILGIKQWLTFTNLLALAILGFAIIVREDIGGIQQILKDTFAAITPLFMNIIESGRRVWILFSGLFEGPFSQDKLMQIKTSILLLVGDIMKNVVEIGSIIGKAIIQWADPFIRDFLPNLQIIWNTVIVDFSSWVAEGGPIETLKNVMDFLGHNLIDSLGGGMFLAATTVLTGGFNQLVNIITGLITRYTPELQQKFLEWKDAATTWLLETLPRIMTGLGVVVGGIAAGIGRGLVKTTPIILKWVLEAINILASLIPGIFRFITSALFTFIAWFGTDGIRTVAESIGAAWLVLMEWFKNTMPTLGFELGKMVGDLLFKIGALVAVFIGYLIMNGPDMIKQFVNWFVTGFVPGLIGVLEGLIKGIAAFIAGMWIGFFEPIVEMAKIFMSDLVQNMLDTFGVAIDENTQKMLENLIRMWDTMVKGVKDFLGIASPSRVFYQIAVDLVQGAIDGFNSLVEDFKELVVGVFETIYNKGVQFTTDMVKSVTTSITTFASDMKTKWENFKSDTTTKWNAAKDAANAAAENIKTTATTAFTTLKDNVSEWWNSIKESIITAVEAAYTAAKEKFESIATEVGKAIDSIKKLLADLVGDGPNSFKKVAEGIGDQIVRGIYAGITSASTWLRNSFGDWLNDNIKGTVDRWIRELLGDRQDDVKNSPGGTTGGSTYGGEGDGSGGGNKTVKTLASKNSIANLSSYGASSAAGMALLNQVAGMRDRGRAAIAGVMAGTINPFSRAISSIAGGARLFTGGMEGQFRDDPIVRGWGDLIRGTIDSLMTASAQNFWPGVIAFLNGINSTAWGGMNINESQMAYLQADAIEYLFDKISHGSGNIPGHGQVNNFNLTVNSQQKSSGVIADFNHMQTLRGI